MPCRLYPAMRKPFIPDNRVKNEIRELSMSRDAEIAFRQGHMKTAARNALFNHSAFRFGMQLASLFGILT